MTNKIKFNIYKINTDKNLNQVLSKIKKKIKKEHILHNEINRDSFKGFVFSDTKEPVWSKCISDLIGEDLNLENKSNSYIIFKEVKNNIYAVSGGKGYYLISNCIEKDFGLKLVPKLFNDNDAVVKKVVENRLVGNLIFNHRLNSNSTPLKFENNFTNIYKELGIKINEAIAKELGIEINEDKDYKIINVMYKNCISINKSFSIEELSKIIDCIDNIKDKNDNFDLFSFKPVKNTKFDSNKIYDGFCEEFIKKLEDGDKWNLIDFSIVGENKSDYYSGYDKYFFDFKYNTHDLSFDSENFITLDCIQKKIIDEKLRGSKTFVKNLFKKGKIKTENESNENLNNTLLNLMEGFYKNSDYDETFFLLNGEWYILEDNFKEYITKNFKEIYKNHQAKSEKILKNFNSFQINWNKSKAKAEENRKNGEKKNINHNESLFNEEFENNEEGIVYADKVNVDNVEIADLIFYFDGTLYLMCNKNKFEASGARELFGQIEMSLNYIQNNFSNNNLKLYYEKLREKNDFLQKDYKDFQVSVKNVCYISAFLFNLKEGSDSSTAKYFVFKTAQLFKDSNFDFLLCGLESIYDK